MFEQSYGNQAIAPDGAYVRDEELFRICGIEDLWIPKHRGTYVSNHRVYGPCLVILSKTGAWNKKDYEEDIENIRNYKTYIDDIDDDDPSYALYYFMPLREYRKTLVSYIKRRQEF